MKSDLSETGRLKTPGRLSAAILFLITCATTARPQGWTQWGGPHRNFKADTKGLAAAWPDKGPRQLWSRELGDGYSSIVADGNRLFTMYRKGEQDIIISLDAQTGKTLWEHKSDASYLPSMKMENGPGPHSTPLVVGDQVFAVGVTGKFHCLDKQTGKVVWSHDLWQEFQGTKLGRGYSSSPIAWKQMVIVTVGGPGHTLMAFNQKDGTVVWAKHDYPNAYPSPILINVDGQDQLIIFMQQEIGGFDPNNGDELWRHPHPTQYGLNISTPVWGEGNLLFFSSACNGGSRVLQLAQKGGKTSVTELWFSNRLRIHIGTAIRLGDYVYGSSGDFGPAFLTAVEIRTGKQLWQDRSFSRANLLYADGKMIILDEDGHLALATVSPEGLKVQAKTDLLNHNSWTAPTLVGSKLYVRDRKMIMALDPG
ncbi:MAG TPA: PQQ-binding-like beta-propeller repeat protein [Blastocatellia bacterium]|nr:PQQ-binding-like beta-propeller repeat protein [Blastocatellia bacterium]